MSEEETKTVDTVADIPAKTMVSKEEYDAVVAELEKGKKAYADLVEAFNKLLQEYNELHVNALFVKK